MLWSEAQHIVHFVKLTVPWMDNVVMAYERKRLRYTELAAEAVGHGWKDKVRPVEVCCMGFVAKSFFSQSAQLSIKG